MNGQERSVHQVVLAAKMAVLVLIFLLSPVLTAWAQDEEVKARIEITEKRIRVLLSEAEELDRAGRAEEARERVKKAEALREKLAELHQRIEGSRPEKVHPQEARELEEILHGLELGMEALERLGRREELEILQQVARQVREEMKGRHREKRHGDEEREHALHQLEVMRLAMHALREADRKDTMELLEHAIHARELALEGKRNEKAMKIRESAPSLEVQTEILFHAADLWHRFGHEKKAATVHELAEEFAGRLRHRKERGEGAIRGEERELVEHEVEVMRMAMPVLRKAGKVDAADMLKYAIQARVVDLEGRNGAEADLVRERAPGFKEQIEILALASRIFRELGEVEKARAVGGLAEEMAARERGTEIDHPEAMARRIRDLEERIAELERELDACRAALRTLRKERR